jgi:hypothetical protein
MDARSRDGGRREDRRALLVSRAKTPPEVREAEKRVQRREREVLDAVEAWCAGPGQQSRTLLREVVAANLDLRVAKKQLSDVVAAAAAAGDQTAEPSA